MNPLRSVRKHLQEIPDKRHSSAPRNPVADKSHRVAFFLASSTDPDAEARTVMMLVTERVRLSTTSNVRRMKDLLPW